MCLQCQTMCTRDHNKTKPQNRCFHDFLLLIFLFVVVIRSLMNPRYLFSILPTAYNFNLACHNSFIHCLFSCYTFFFLRCVRRIFSKKINTSAGGFDIQHVHATTFHINFQVKCVLDFKTSFHLARQQRLSARRRFYLISFKSQINRTLPEVCQHLKALFIETKHILCVI